MWTFEWNPEKSKSNLKKHGISFEEAKSVFFDINARLIDDPDHSDEEQRFILLGYSEGIRLLTVCHCEKEENSIIRIISARKATQKERKIYEEK